MIEAFNFMVPEWQTTEHKTLREYIEAHSHHRPCKIKNTNQDDFDRVYLYHWDNMGHMYWIRMPEDDYNNEMGKTDLYEQQQKDYNIFTGPDGYVSKTPHTICGKCDRCKNCGDCTCEDKHKLVKQ